MSKHILPFSLLCAVICLAGCSHIPKGAQAIGNFEKERYLGTWYEIARFDFAFERNLDNTTAEYSVLDDRYITVRNSGYNYVKKEWQDVVGKAKFRGPDTVGELKVSFFGPFYGAYNIIALDPDYRYALIAGKNLKYLWILSRTKDIPDGVKNEYVDKARSLGYKTENLIWVKHND